MALSGSVPVVVLTDPVLHTCGEATAGAVTATESKSIAATAKRQSLLRPCTPTLCSSGLWRPRLVQSQPRPQVRNLVAVEPSLTFPRITVDHLKVPERSKGTSLAASPRCRERRDAPRKAPDRRTAGPSNLTHAPVRFATERGPLLAIQAGKFRKFPPARSFPQQWNTSSGLRRPNCKGEPCYVPASLG